VAAMTLEHAYSVKTVLSEVDLPYTRKESWAATPPNLYSYTMSHSTTKNLHLLSLFY
jgi:hypothetical protein